jgi:hypothetical protein
MPENEKQTPPDRGPPAGDQGPRRSGLEKALKWVGAITAILSLIFGLVKLAELVSDVGERQRQIAELHKVGKQQQSAADYEGAWASFEQALKAAEPGGQLAKLTGQLSDERRALREAQEDLAMEWLRNLSVPKGKTFSDVVDKLVAVVHRGAASASGARKADLLAHLGWADFLRWRDGNRRLNPERQYREALEIDPANPYAHAHLGHWMLWAGEKPQEARQHFSSALASGRAREYVRGIQLAAVRNRGSDGDREFLAVVNDMRKNGEKLGSRTRSDVYSIYSFACAMRHDASRLAGLLAAVPATEQLATFQALFYGANDEDFDAGRRQGRDACLATLMEAAGQQEEALRTWLAIRQNLPPGNGSRLGDRAQDAMKRLSTRR